jgi:AcrR family transcriptional regulator
VPVDSTSTAPAAPKRRRADAERNIQRILDAADEAVSRHGADASVEEIARLAGVGAATLYRHFPSRMALMEALFSGRMEALCLGARKLAHQADADDALEVWLRAMVSLLVEAQAMLAALTMQGVVESDPEGNFASGLAVAFKAADELVEEARRRGVVRDDVSGREVVELMVGVCMAVDRVRHPALQDDRRAERLLDLILGGLLIGNTAKSRRKSRFELRAARR